MDTDKKFILGGALVAALVLLFIVKKADPAKIGAGLGEAVVDLVGGAAAGALDGVSKAAKIPTTKETITDAQQCKLYMDKNGVWAASFHCGAPAFIEALTL